ncbi:hypothetical protein LJC51_09230 [Lachnospiraceae bacterium OttesenSCG-928-J05]|nr:hypothetical protein [Lachnospiraceae bacterium OttesenSCG-928-J05]
MDIKDLQKKIDNMDYWDCKILDFQINFFGDEVRVVIEGDNKVDFIINFAMCYKVDYETDARNRWKGMEVKSMNKLQLGYFAHDISVCESEIEGFIDVKLEMPMLYAKIVCKKVSIEQAVHNENVYFWSRNV